MISDEQFNKLIEHLDARLGEIADNTKPRDLTLKVDNPAIVYGELLSHNQILRHQGKPYDRVKAAQSDLAAAQKKLAAKQEGVTKAQVELREAEQKVRDLASNLANERRFQDFVHFGR